MSKAQVILLVVLVLGFIGLGIILARDTASPFTTDKPFMARAGTSREKARAITAQDAPRTKGTPTPEGPRRPLAPVPDAPPPPAAISTIPAPLPVSPYEALLAAASPEEGLSLAYEQLANAAGDDLSEIYRTIGLLQSRVDPADPAAALAAFDAAKNTATSPGQALQADLEAVRILHQAGRGDEAIDRADAALAGQPPATATALHLVLARADALAESDASRGEEAYRDVMQRALAAEAEMGAPALEVYRLAGLRLARFYRLQQRDQDAIAVGQEVRQRAGQIE